MESDLVVFGFFVLYCFLPSLTEFQIDVVCDSTLIRNHLKARQVT